jgi:hypothetical protein
MASPTSLRSTIYAWRSALIPPTRHTTGRQRLAVPVSRLLREVQRAEPHVMGCCSSPVFRFRLVVLCRSLSGRTVVKT